MSSPEEGAAEGRAGRGPPRVEAAAAPRHLSPEIAEAGHPQVQLPRHRRPALSRRRRRHTPNTPAHHLQASEESL